MLKDKIIILTLLVIVFSSLSSIVALTDSDYAVINEKHEFNTDEFIFEYNDHNTTVYEGDSGLKGAYAKNIYDNYTYYLPDENVRGIAYATKKSFKLKEDIIVTHSLVVYDRAYDCIMLKMEYKNGTVIPTLDVKDKDLTAEQKTYFDDYNTQRSDYLMQQQQYAAEDLYDYEVNSHRYKQGNSKYSYYYGSNGRGVIYTPSYSY